MTEKELKKIPFQMTGHLSQKDAHYATYTDKSGRLRFCDCTPKINEFEFGKTTRTYWVDGVVYETYKEFVKAVKNITL